MTKENFKKGMAILQATFPERFGEFSKAHYRVWFVILNDLSNQQWETTILFIARNFEKPPTPAQIRKLATQQAELTAEEAWAMVTDAVRCVGRYSMPHFKDEGLNKAIRGIGWTTICDCRCDELAGLRAHFFRTYEAMKRRVHTDREYKALENPELKKLLPWQNTEDT